MYIYTICIFKCLLSMSYISHMLLNNTSELSSRRYIQVSCQARKLFGANLQPSYECVRRKKNKDEAFFLLPPLTCQKIRQIMILVPRLLNSYFVRFLNEVI